MAGKYATETTVTAEASRAEIERTLGRYGADAFGFSIDGRRASIAFRLKGRHFRFRLELPDPSSPSMRQVNKGALGMASRTPAQVKTACDKEARQRWRALALVIKAKLEAVEVGIVSLEDEFMAQTVLPNGATMAEEYGPQIEDAYRLGQMPKTLMLDGPRP